MEQITVTFNPQVHTRKNKTIKLTKFQLGQHSSLNGEMVAGLHGKQEIRGSSVSLGNKFLKILIDNLLLHTSLRMFFFLIG